MRNRIKQVIVSALVVAFGTTQAWAALNDTTNGAYLDTGSNSYLRVPNSSSLNITGAITVEAWWRFDSSQTIYTDPALQSTTAVEIVKRGGGTVGSGVSDGYGYKVTPGNSSQTLGGGIFGRIAVYQPETIDNNWHHFAWTFDGSVMRLYYDGQQVNQGNYTGQIGATSSDLYFGVGQLEDGTFYPGTDDAGWYDEIRIWNVARTPSQIAATWNVPLTVPSQTSWAYGTSTVSTALMRVHFTMMPSHQPARSLLRFLNLVSHRFFCWRYARAFVGVSRNIWLAKIR